MHRTHRSVPFPAPAITQPHPSRKDASQGLISAVDVSIPFSCLPPEAKSLCPYSTKIVTPKLFSEAAGAPFGFRRLREPHRLLHSQSMKVPCWPLWGNQSGADTTLVREIVLGNMPVYLGKTRETSIKRRRAVQGNTNKTSWTTWISKAARWTQTPHGRRGPGKLHGKMGLELDLDCCKGFRNMVLQKDVQATRTGNSPSFHHVSHILSFHSLKRKLTSDSTWDPLLHTVEPVMA